MHVPRNLPVLAVSSANNRITALENQLLFLPKRPTLLWVYVPGPALFKKPTILPKIL